MFDVEQPNIWYVYLLDTGKDFKDILKRIQIKKTFDYIHTQVHSVSDW